MLKKIQKYLKKKMGNCGVGDGEKLSEYLTECASSADIEAFEEKIDKKRSEITQKPKLGSSRTFTELQEIMKSSCDVLIYIHGFNVSWYEAVGSALSLQTMLQNTGETKKKNIVVVLFTWPSDGSALPFVSYRSDRSEAQGSGAAVGRALLKTRDYLIKLRGKANDEKNELCKQEIHLACHSMGNFLLQEILSRISDFTPGNALPRIFEHVFLCAPDVDDNIPGKPDRHAHDARTKRRKFTYRYYLQTGGTPAGALRYVRCLLHVDGVFTGRPWLWLVCAFRSCRTGTGHSEHMGPATGPAGVIGSHVAERRP